MPFPMTSLGRAAGQVADAIADSSDGTPPARVAVIAETDGRLLVRSWTPEDGLEEDAGDYRIAAVVVRSGATHAELLSALRSMAERVLADVALTAVDRLRLIADLAAPTDGGGGPPGAGPAGVRGRTAAGGSAARCTGSHSRDAAPYTSLESLSGLGGLTRYLGGWAPTRALLEAFEGTRISPRHSREARAARESLAEDIRRVIEARCPQTGAPCSCRRVRCARPRAEG